MGQLESDFSKISDQYHNFKITKVILIDELQCVLKEIVHEPSGATIVHISNDDPENVFCLALRTLPETSDGVAHILEHTVLCGSKKFPVKDPFFSMTRRSLNTYMNALTSPDFTCYPAASQVPKDFYNLLEVYLDAVFHPELKELSFLQEGHRLEFTEPANSNSPLIFKGIVFNEMKGVLSSPFSRLWESIMQALFPNILYHYNYGGDPKEIPSLTYEQLIAFHRKFYQESRCTFYFYGNLPIKGHLDFLEKNTLKTAQKLPPLAPNPIQPHFTKPVSVQFGYPIADHEEVAQKTYIAMAWLTCSLKEQTEVLALQVLDLILMGTDASLLKLELLKANLCQNVHSMFEDSLSQIPYGLIFEGTEKEHLETLKQIIYKKLEEIAKKPIATELIEAALHQLEFSRTEINSDYGPFGLSLILKSVPVKNVGSKIEDNLKIHSQFEKLREKLKDPYYLCHLIKKYWIENTHFITSVMFPDKTLIKKETDEERKTLDKIQAKLSSQDKEKIIQKALELKNFQEAQEHQNLEVLPKVTLEDVFKNPRVYELKQSQLGNAKLFYHPCFTNGILYQSLAFKLPKLSFDELPLVRLYAYLVTQIGTGKKDYKTHLQEVQSHTGGIAAFLENYISVNHIDQYHPYLFFQGKALKHKQEHLIDLLYEIATNPSFDDQERIKELITQLFVELDQQIKQNSLRFAANFASSGFYSHSYISYYWSGLGYYSFIKTIMANLNQNIGPLIENLKKLKERLIHGNHHSLITTCDEKQFASLTPSLQKLANITKKPYQEWDPNFHPHQITCTGKASSSSVFFTSMLIKTPGFSNPYSAYLNIAAELFDNTHLHKAIREQGGAYGGGSSHKMNAGYFSFHAYRDPNLAATIQAFYQAVKKISLGQFSDRELEEAKLGVIQKLDQPLSPEQQALTAYSWFMEGKTYELRKKLRDEIIQATPSQIKQAVNAQLLEKMHEAIVVSFGSRAALEKENQKLGQENLKILKIEDL